MNKGLIILLILYIMFISIFVYDNKLKEDERLKYLSGASNIILEQEQRINELESQINDYIHLEKLVYDLSK